MRRRKGTPIHGWLALDKPADVTSAHAVAIVRRLFGAQKTGHAGTLDPLATGLLPIAFGEATKTVQHVMDRPKRYRFTVGWGAATDTDDSEGTVIARSDSRPTDNEVDAALRAYEGDIDQIPPQVSAIRVDGVRAYERARSGEDVPLSARRVRVHEIARLTTPDRDHCVLEALCGKGTYVRSIARDLGRDLACLGHVCALRRTSIGALGEDDMISLDKLRELSHSAAGREALFALLKPVETALDDIPALAVSEADAQRLSRGQPILLRGRDAPILKGPAYATRRGRLVAVGEVNQGRLTPKRVFNLAT